MARYSTVFSLFFIAFTGKSKRVPLFADQSSEKILFLPRTDFLRPTSGYKNGKFGLPRSAVSGNGRRDGSFCLTERLLTDL